jgi:hypothetical protein
MKFIVTFYSCFIVLWLLLYMFLDRSNEMLAYLIWFNGIYLLIGCPSWLVINTLIKDRNVLNQALQFVLGFLILNLITYFVYNEIPLFSIITLTSDRDQFWISIYLYMIYVTSFMMAAFTRHKMATRIESL